MDDRHIATIRSLVHAPVVGGIIVGDDGFYELEVHVNELEIENSRDPQGYVNHQIARHLASCAQRTKVPMGENLWFVQFHPQAQRDFNLPKEAWF
jgi:hypothetical protein